MADLGKYLYCIIRCSQERPVSGVLPIGDTDSSVHTMPHDDLAVVVSDSPVMKYEITRANMLAHQRVQEAVMKEFPILPVRFGTVADPASPIESIQRLLEKRSGEFHQLLDYVETRNELGVKALWRDEKVIFQEIVAENPVIKRLRDSLEGKPAQATHFDRMRLGEMVKEALEGKRRREAEPLMASLRSLADRWVENPVFVDRMILNSAFLVAKNREDEFGGAVDHLDSELGHRIALKYVGPLPPYNFVNIIVNWGEL